MSEVKKVTLAHKKNIRDAEEKKPALLARIKAATGVDFEFVVEPSTDEYILALMNYGNSYHEKFGNALYFDDGYLAALANLFEKSCKDSMVKEALVDALPKKKLVLRLNEEKFNQIEFQDGCLILFAEVRSFYKGIASIPNIDIAKLL